MSNVIPSIIMVIIIVDDPIMFAISYTGAGKWIFIMDRINITKQVSNGTEENRFRKKTFREGFLLFSTKHLANAYVPPVVIIALPMPYIVAAIIASGEKTDAMIGTAYPFTLLPEQFSIYSAFQLHLYFWQKTNQYNKESDSPELLKQTLTPE